MKISEHSFARERCPNKLKISSQRRIEKVKGSGRWSCPRRSPNAGPTASTSGLEMGMNPMATLPHRPRGKLPPVLSDEEPPHILSDDEDSRVGHPEPRPSLQPRYLHMRYLFQPMMKMNGWMNSENCPMMIDVSLLWMMSRSLSRESRYQWILSGGSCRQEVVSQLVCSSGSDHGVWESSERAGVKI